MNLRHHYLIPAFALFVAGGLFASVSNTAGAASCCGTGAATAAHSTSKSDAKSAVFEKYEAVSKALLHDDLEATIKASGELAHAAEKSGNKELAKAAKLFPESANLAEAREAYKQVSIVLIDQVRNEKGYYVMTCPMVEDGQWLQANRETANPYMGQRMPRCGGVKSETGI